METPESIDLIPIRQLFPHIPGVVFETARKKPVDMLVGNNFLHLHPVGGQGRDAVGSLRVMPCQTNLEQAG